MITTSTIAEIGALLGDPARVNIVLALLDGRARTAAELAAAAGVTAQTTSTHLAKLVAGGLIVVTPQGRHRYHRLASGDVARLLEQMCLAGSSVTRQVTKTVGPRDAAMRNLRSCYDHLAGRVAVDLASTLLAGEWPKATGALSAAGEERLMRIGVDLGALHRLKRPLCLPCLDWSERKPHVAGALGAALLERLKELAWIRTSNESRSLLVTPVGEQGFERVFGVRAEPNHPPSK